MLLTPNTVGLIINQVHQKHSEIPATHAQRKHLDTVLREIMLAWVHVDQSPNNIGALSQIKVMIDAYRDLYEDPGEPREIAQFEKLSHVKAHKFGPQ